MLVLVLVGWGWGGGTCAMGCQSRWGTVVLVLAGVGVGQPCTTGHYCGVLGHTQ